MIDRCRHLCGIGVVILAGMACLSARGADATAPFDPLASIATALGSPVTVTAVIERRNGGDVVAVTAMLEPGWHLYSLDQKPGGPQATRITIAKDSPAGPLGPFRPDVAPLRRVVQGVPGWEGLVVEEHEGSVTWRADVGSEATEVRGSVSMQLCRDNACTPPETIAFVATRSTASGAAIGQPTPDPAVPPPGAVGPSPVAALGPLPPDRGLSLPMVVLMGLAGGLILNLMPCVLPVLGLKLMSFAEQSGRARQEILWLNLWYCAGLYAVFFALATASVAANLGLSRTNLAWGEQFSSTAFNVAMCCLVFAFALSFLGVWELPIPGFIGARAGGVQSREGPAASFLKGVLSTVLATPCSGPFLGPVFGFTLTQPTAVTYVVFAAIATGMALPYLLVGVAPGLVRYLPKPGAWMETLKEVLGFMMLGTVVFLFTFLDHQWFVPTFAVLVGIWAACWWVGRAQAASGGTVGFGRWIGAGAIAGIVGAIAFTFLGPVSSVIPWEPFSRERLADLRRRGATVLVDFSADWCMTCKYNLATAIETDTVKREIERNRVVPLLADWTGGSSEIKLMLESLQSRSIPVLAVFPAARGDGPPPDPIVLRDLITESQVLDALRRAGPSKAAPGEIRAAAVTPGTAGH